MQLTLREAAGYLGVSETTARRWIGERALPVHEANERLYLNAVELWEWAIEHGVRVSRKLLTHAQAAPDPVPPMSELLRAGGILYDVDGKTKQAVLRELVARLPLPAGQDRATLLSVLQAREAMGSTGIGGGIAIPHARSPIVLAVDKPFVTLCLLPRAVDFGALDGQPVHTLFLVVSPIVPVHLRILAQIGFLMRDDELRTMLASRAKPEQILGRIEMLETSKTTGSFRVHASR